VDPLRISSKGERIERLMSRRSRGKVLRGTRRGGQVRKKVPRETSDGERTFQKKAYLRIVWGEEGSLRRKGTKEEVTP